MFFEFAVEITQHAQERMEQRHVSRLQVIEILRLGKREHRDDCVRVRLHESHVEAEVDRRVINLLGIIVVLSPDERFVKTVIRKGEPKYPPAVLRHFQGPSPTFKLGEIFEQKLQALLARCDGFDC